MKKTNIRVGNRQKVSKNAKKASTSMPVSAPFPIAGIGASAGGLEALEQFLRNVPERCGIGFVIVQHLDPTHKGILPELLQRATGMEVYQVQDRMPVKPDAVYVIPPNKDMSILHGVLHLFEPEAPRGLRLPIDFFFCSLADDQQQRSIGVILSGMGTDGTLGLRAIKEKAGLVVVQDPASAKFDSMPHSAIAAGLADIVAPAGELPGRIDAYLRHAPGLAEPKSELAEKEQSTLEKVVILLRATTGHDFSLYKKNTLYRRIERRMGIHQLNRIADYVRYLQENSNEVELLFRELLIGVTSFFRDPTEWELLRDKLLPELLVERPEGGVLRAWSAGCSSGEEAYSLAISFKEALDKVKPTANFSLQIFATDLDHDAIELARQGFFPVNIAAQVSQQRLQRYFNQEESGFRIKKEIREMVTFATQNIIMDPPFIKLDFLICRNLLIYLEPDLQKRLLQLFHYSLNPGGLLFLGSAETVGNLSPLFATTHAKSKLFRRRETVIPPENRVFPAMLPTAPPEPAKETTMPRQPANLQSLAEQLLLRDYSPPAVLVSDQGDILYISGRTGKYLEPASGKVNWNLFAMARDGLRFELTGAFQKAVRDQEAVTLKGLKVGGNTKTQSLELSIQPIREPEALQGMVLVVFRDVPSPPAAQKSGRIKAGTEASVRIAALEEELKEARKELQATREGIQSSQEELKSMNEELQSTNEELQSTNEELTTSKEEMQSMNEELQTVNAEQVAKMEEMERVSNDMQNLLNSTEIITLFLDNELRIKRFTPGANKLFKLIAGDVGRPLTDLSSELFYPELPADAGKVLQTLAFREKQVSASDGRWFTARIMPYRTADNRIDGVVMTFADITRAKQLEAELRSSGGMFQALLKDLPTLIIGLSEEGRILEFNPVAEREFDLTRAEVVGRDFVEQFIPEADRTRIAADLQKMLTAELQALTTEVTTADQRKISLRWSACPDLTGDSKGNGLIAIGQNMQGDAMIQGRP
ncbi:MAG: PAS domain-containing protein [Desulfuromonadaceae bacterium]|nr:PAS domain-containing protein [Desulfuromonadaceae bacterium]